MDDIFYTMGLSQMSRVNLGYLFGAVLLVCVLAGWITDALLKASGFGVIGNTLLMFFWLCVGLVLYSLYVKQLRIERFPIILGVGAGSAFIGLLISAFVKRAVASEE